MNSEPTSEGDVPAAFSLLAGKLAGASLLLFGTLAVGHGRHADEILAARECRAPMIAPSP